MWGQAHLAWNLGGVCASRTVGSTLPAWKPEERDASELLPVLLPLTEVAEGQ